MNSLYSPAKYAHPELVDPLFEKVKLSISNISLEYLEQFVKNRIQDSQKDETYFLLQYKEGKSIFITNNTQEEDINLEENTANQQVDWLYFNLYDKGWDSLTEIDSVIKTYFEDLIEDLKTFPGLRVAGLHFAKPFTIVLPHVDYNVKENSMNLVFVIQAEGALMKTNNKEYTLHNNQIFIFDAGIEHSVENFTDKPLIVFTLRIDGNYII